MLEQRLSKIDFLGKDGFQWFIGQVTTDCSWRDYSLKNGYRAKVRILGRHPSDNTISDEELPWAHFLLPPNLGSNNNFGGQSFALQGGETVIGFFLDGEDAQQPLVIGSLPAGPFVGEPIDYKSIQLKKTTAFQPVGINSATEFGGHTVGTRETIINQRGGLVDENNEVPNLTGEKSETHISYLNDETIPIRRAQKCVVQNNVFSDINKELKTFTALIERYEYVKDGYVDKIFNEVIPINDFEKLIDKSAEKIAGLSSVSIRFGRKELFRGIDEAVDANLDFLDPQYLIKKMGIEEQLGELSCFTENMIGGLQGVVKDLLKEMAGKIANIGLCAAEQFVSGLNSKIMDLGDSVTSGPIANISGLISGVSLPSFSGSFTDALGMVQTGLALFECENNGCEPDPFDWSVGVGPDAVKKLDLGRMKDLSGAISALSGGLDPKALASKMFPGIESISSGLLGNTPDFIDGLGEKVFERSLNLDLANRTGFGMDKLVGGCQPFTKKCGPPSVEIFGGGGLGAAGKAVINQAGKIVGVNMDSLGSGFTSPPYVSFVDQCNNGGGATGKALIVDGMIDKIVIQDPGSGYLGPESALSDEDGTEVVGVMDGIDVIRTGVGYKEGDTITTSDGQLLEPVLANGRIVGATPVNVTVGITDLPDLVINTGTGFGAIIRPTVKFTKVSEYKDPLVPDTKLIRVIDCPRGY